MARAPRSARDREVDRTTLPDEHEEELGDGGLPKEVQERLAGRPECRPHVVLSTRCRTVNGTTACRQTSEFYVACPGERSELVVAKTKETHGEAPGTDAHFFEAMRAAANDRRAGDMMRELEELFGSLSPLPLRPRVVVPSHPEVVPPTLPWAAGEEARRRFAELDSHRGSSSV